MISIRRALVAPHLDRVAVYAQADTGKWLRHIHTDWDNARHPHEVATAVAIRGRIYPEYWVACPRPRINPSCRGRISG